MCTSLRFAAATAHTRAYTLRVHTRAHTGPRGAARRTPHRPQRAPACRRHHNPARPTGSLRLRLAWMFCYSI